MDNKKNNNKLPKEAFRVFESFGFISYTSQIFESDIVTFYLIVDRIIELGKHLGKTPEKFLNPKLFDKIWISLGKKIESNLNKLTLGQLLSTDKREKSLRELEIIRNNNKNSLKNVFDNLINIYNQVPFEDWIKALKRRNDLIHNFFYHNEIAFLDPVKCIKLLNKLNDDICLFENCVVQVRSINEKIVKLIGFDLSDYNEKVRKEMNRLLDEFE